MTGSSVFPLLVDLPWMAELSTPSHDEPTLASTISANSYEPLVTLANPTTYDDLGKCSLNLACRGDLLGSTKCPRFPRYPKNELRLNVCLRLTRGTTALARRRTMPLHCFCRGLVMWARPGAGRFFLK